jgi:hypothetical protein
MDAITWVTIGLTAVTGILLIASVSMISKYTGSTDSWQTIQPQVQTATALTISGTVAACIAFGLITVNHPDYAGIIAVCMSTVAFGIAFGALATAAISRPQS